MAKHQYVGLHADSLDDGRPVAPGDIVDISGELSEYDASMVADGRLVPVKEESKSKKEGSGS